MTKPKGDMRIAVLSDTHGLLRPEILSACMGCSHILHAGDVGDPSILTALKQIAPLTAIRGNIDIAGPCAKLPATEMVELSGRFFYLAHSIADLDIQPAAAGVHAVLSGHSHKPAHETRNGILFLNPGSAGPRRFRLPIAMARLTLHEQAIEVEPLQFDL